MASCMRTASLTGVGQALSTLQNEENETNEDDRSESTTFWITTIIAIAIAICGVFCVLICIISGCRRSITENKGGERYSPRGGKKDRKKKVFEEYPLLEEGSLQRPAIRRRLRLLPTRRESGVVARRFRVY